MKTLKQILEAYGQGKRGWTPTSGTSDHDEVLYQLHAHEQGQGTLHPSIHKALNHLSDPKTYSQALQRSKVEILNHHDFGNVENSTAGDSWMKNRQSLDRDKVNRAETQASDQRAGRSTLSMPVAIRARNRTTGEVVTHSLAGNTRQAYHAGSGVPTQVIHYDHD